MIKFSVVGVVLFVCIGSYAQDGAVQIDSLKQSLLKLNQGLPLPVSWQGQVPSLDIFFNNKYKEVSKSLDDLDYPEIEKKQKLAELKDLTTGVCRMDVQSKHRRDKVEEIVFELKEIQRDGTIGIRREFRVAAISNRNIEITSKDGFLKIEAHLNLSKGLFSANQTLELSRLDGVIQVKFTQTARAAIRKQSSIFECRIGEI